MAYFEHDALFRRMGWETAVMAMRHPRNEPSEWEEYFVDEIEFGHQYGALKRVAMAGKVIYSFEARRKLARLLERFRPDIAHAHCIYHHLSPSVLALLKERGIPIVMTAHDLKLICPAYKMFNSTGICERCRNGNLTNVLRYRCIHGSFAASTLVMVESYVHRWLGLYRKTLDRIVVPSQFFANKLEEWGWPSDRIAYIPNFIRAEAFDPGYAPGKYFLYFGRLVPEKGVGTLIEAVNRSGVSLRIAGTGPDEARLTQLAAGNPRIQFLGFRSGTELGDQIRGALAVVLPSELYENAPMSVFEAYASGKPVIGARIGGIPELILDGETGVLFDPGEEGQLADRLAMMTRASANNVAEMGRAARDYVSTKFSRERYESSMLTLYGQLGVKLVA